LHLDADIASGADKIGVSRATRAPRIVAGGSVADVDDAGVRGQIRRDQSARDDRTGED